MVTPAKNDPASNIIIGAGRHAYVIIDMLQENGVSLAGVLDPKPETSSILGVPVLGDDDLLQGLRALGVQGFVVAVGENRLRRKLFDAALAAGLTPINAIHHKATISRHAKLGQGIVIMANAVINVEAEIGDNTIINTGATIDHHNRIGSDVHIAPGCHLAGCVSVGRYTFLGTGVSVIPDIAIGDNVVVGAGTTVYRDIAANQKVVGAAMRYPASAAT